VNAGIFLYMFLVYVPNAFCRSGVISQARWVPEVKGYLTRVDVITITLSLDSLGCGITIAVILGPRRRFCWVVMSAWPCPGRYFVDHPSALRFD
jgi:hypothetical protein